jgi:hypothetical protein
MTEERLPGPSVGSDLPFELPPCLSVSSHAVNLRGSNRDFDHHHLLHAARLALYFPMPDERCGFFSRWRSCCDNIFGVSRLAFQAPL